MIVKNEKPPNYEKLNKIFDLDNVGKDRGIVFAWGDTIYAPNGGSIDNHVLCHEEVHGEQQEKVGGPAIWWDRYIEDVPFRVQQELEAYREQYLYIKQQTVNRDEVARCLMILARDLSGPMYGNSMSYPDALKAIRKS